MRPSPLLAFISFASAALATGAARLEERANDPDDPTGKFLYITEPACGYYQCIVTWPVGSGVAVNWLGPPAGQVSVSLASNNGGPTYEIVDSIAGISQEGYCDSGYGMGVVAPGHECGRVEFVIPLKWERMDNYTIVVQSLSNPDLIGYTDMITISGPDPKLTVPNPPSGTAVSLLTIADPTATNRGASTKFTGKIPASTAVTGSGNKSSAGAAEDTSDSTTAPSTTVARVQRSSSASSSSASVSPTSTSTSTPSSALSAASTSSLTATAANLGAASSSAAPSAVSTGAAPAGALVGRTIVALAGVAALVAFTL